MEQVGMRELRHRLREYVTRADAGERFEVTESGRPVALLTPIPDGPATIARLVADGRITPAVAPDTQHLPTPAPVTTGMTASEALLAERRGDAR